MPFGTCEQDFLFQFGQFSSDYYKTSFENWRSEVGKEKLFEFVLHEGNKTGTIYLYFHRSGKLEGRSKALKAP
uniref:Uncharacterized protein n=1 Tax=Romanomermis culicivorax TaxID=13658 RepID=A0A915K8C4_ROMCU